MQLKTGNYRNCPYLQKTSQAGFLTRGSSKSASEVMVIVNQVQHCDRLAQKNVWLFLVFNRNEFMNHWSKFSTYFISPTPNTVNSWCDIHIVFKPGNTATCPKQGRRTWCLQGFSWWISNVYVCICFPLRMQLRHCPQRQRNFAVLAGEWLLGKFGYH